MPSFLLSMPPDNFDPSSIGRAPAVQVVASPSGLRPKLGTPLSQPWGGREQGGKNINTTLLSFTWTLKIFVLFFFHVTNAILDLTSMIASTASLALS